MRIAPKLVRKAARLARKAIVKTGEVMAKHGGTIGTVAGGAAGLAFPKLGPKVGSAVGGIIGKVGGHIVKRMMEKNN